jgi:transcriptional regulator with XRE-family HTH domain
VTLQDWLKDNKLTQDQFAQAVGCDQAYVSRLTSKKRTAPSLDMIRRITVATNGAVTANDFMDAPEHDAEHGGDDTAPALGTNHGVAA